MHAAPRRPPTLRELQQSKAALMVRGAPLNTRTPDGTVDNREAGVPGRSPGNEFPGAFALGRLQPSARAALGVPFSGLFSDSAGDFIPVLRGAAYPATPLVTNPTVADPLDIDALIAA